MNPADNSAPAASDAILTEKRFSPKEAATELKKCTKTVLSLISRKEIYPVFRNAKSGPGAIEIPESSIRSYQRARLSQAASSPLN